MVPDRFQAPIRAPTASRMNTAPSADVTPPITASRTEASVYPFLNATRPAKTALTISAICSGPSAASVPKVTIVRPIRRLGTRTDAPLPQRQALGVEQVLQGAELRGKDDRKDR